MSISANAMERLLPNSAAGGYSRWHYAGSYLQAGTYVSKILSGAKPSELPVLQPTRIEMVRNPKTATAFGLAVSNDLLTGADAIVE